MVPGDKGLDIGFMPGRGVPTPVAASVKQAKNPRSHKISAKLGDHPEANRPPRRRRVPASPAGPAKHRASEQIVRGSIIPRLLRLRFGELPGLRGPSLDHIDMTGQPPVPEFTVCLVGIQRRSRSNDPDNFLKTPSKIPCRIPAGLGLRRSPGNVFSLFSVKIMEKSLRTRLKNHHKTYILTW